MIVRAENGQLLLASGSHTGSVHVPFTKLLQAKILPGTTGQKQYPAICDSVQRVLQRREPLGRSPGRLQGGPPSSIWRQLSTWARAGRDGEGEREPGT